MSASLRHEVIIALRNFFIGKLKQIKYQCCLVNYVFDLEEVVCF